MDDLPAVVIDPAKVKDLEIKLLQQTIMELKAKLDTIEASQRTIMARASERGCLVQ